MNYFICLFVPDQGFSRDAFSWYIAAEFIHLTSIRIGSGSVSISETPQFHWQNGYTPVN